MFLVFLSVETSESIFFLVPIVNHRDAPPCRATASPRYLRGCLFRLQQPLREKTSGEGDGTGWDGTGWDHTLAL